MDRTLCAFCAVFCLLIFSCFASDGKGGINNKVAEGAQNNNKEIEKLGNVLSRMKERAKASIPNGDANEFLSDLYKVLESDKDDLLILCDKAHPIGESYAPSDIVTLKSNDFYNVNREGLSLRECAEKSLEKMGQKARKDGITLLASSTYRTYKYQQTVYNRLVRLEGQEVADRESARPGTSQHQLGTVIDFGNIDDSFIESAQCKWLNQNAQSFGWSLSFPDGYEQDTGYRYECWHFRYIGEEACKFQEKWFSGIQQYMLEFIDAWKKS